MARFCFLAGLTLLCVGQARIALSQPKSPLPRHFVFEEFRLFYTVEGDSAVPTADRNENDVPDHIEDVAKQLWASHQLYCHVLKFPDPFESARYDGVTCIEAYVRERSEIGGRNGVAYENPQRAKPIPEGMPTDRTLVMGIGNHVDARKNITPAHEMFHLIQYGATYFKNRWYLEGMARWSEHGLQLDGVGNIKYSEHGPWPHSPADLSEVFQMTYEAEFAVWNPLALRTDAIGLLPRDQLPAELVALRYSDGTPVLRDHLLNGAVVMRDVLNELAKQDDIAYQDLGYEDWSEDNQRSSQNDRYIYQAIMDALRKHTETVGGFKARMDR